MKNILSPMPKISWNFLTFICFLNIYDMSLLGSQWKQAFATLTKEKRKIKAILGRQKQFKVVSTLVCHLAQELALWVRTLAREIIYSKISNINLSSNSGTVAFQAREGVIIDQDASLNIPMGCRVLYKDHGRYH